MIPTKQLLLICAVVAVVGCGKNEAKPPTVEIADPILEKAIRAQFNRPRNMELTEVDLAVTSLSFDDKKLTEVPKGLEKLTQLESLDLQYNQLTDVTGLENLTRLTKLNLNVNKLTEVKGLENLAQLEWLWLGGNKLTDVKGLEKLTQLEVLYLGANKLTSVKGLENLTKLTSLWLDHNQLTNVDVKGLEKLTQLEELELNNNPDLTKAQIDELQKALPKCKIESNPTK